MAAIARRSPTPASTWGGVRGGDQAELSERRDHIRQIPCHQARQRSRRRSAASGGEEQIPDQGPALHFPEERRSFDDRGKGDAVRTGVIVESSRNPTLSRIEILGAR